MRASKILFEVEKLERLDRKDEAYQLMKEHIESERFYHDDDNNDNHNEIDSL